MSLRNGIRNLRKFALRGLLACSLAVIFAAPGAHAQALDRKVKSKISPTYPEIARKMGLSGVVKLEVVVAPNGNVKDTKVIGGHPILVNAVVDAVKKWKFESASADTTGTLEFRFDPEQ